MLKYLSFVAKNISKNAVTIADVFLIYTILAPIILNMIGSIVNLQENQIRTFFILLGPGLISLILYVKNFGLDFVKENRSMIIVVSCLTIIIFASSIKNWNFEYSRESFKFFLAYCLFGFNLGVVSKISIGRAWNFFSIWFIFILGFLLICFLTFQFLEIKKSDFRLPGDNSARTAALFYFFSFCILIKTTLSIKVTAKLLYGAIFILCVYIGIISMSRSAMVLYFFLLLIFILFQIIQNRSKFNIISLVSIPIAVSVIFFTAWFGFADKKFKTTILSIVSLPKQTIAYVFEDSQTAYGKVNRFPTWRDAISKFMDNPIFGIGYGSEYYNDAGNYIRRHPHSILLQFLAETGVIGLGTFLIFIGMVFRKAVLNYRKLQNSSDKLIYLLYPMSFVFFLLFSFFHFAIHENYFFWYFAGMIAGFDAENSGVSQTAV